MLLAATLLATPIKFYVAPNGNDRWSGTISRPNRAGTDGPFASVAAARDRLRKVPKSLSSTVEVAAGTYRLQEPIVFTPADSGQAGSWRRYVGTGSSKNPTTISGMRVITGWTRLKNGFLRAKVAKGWVFSQLFVNGERRYRARLPKTGYYTIAEALAPSSETVNGYDRFRFGAGDIRPSWAGKEEIEILAFHNWHISRHRIGAIDGDAVALRPPTGFKDSWAGLPKGNRYLVENVKEALTEPGEWYLDRQGGELTYVPMAGETPQRMVVEAPVATALLEFRGDLKSQNWVESISVSGLQLEGAQWNLGPEGRVFPQAEADLPGAVRFEGARGCAFKGNAIRHTGAYGVEIGAACKRIDVVSNTLEDLGGGGVKVGETDWQQNADLLTERCLVQDNVITAGGRLHPASVGVWVGQNPYITVAGNHIRDLYYTGISVGWSWGYQPNGAHHNTIASNRISQIGQGVLSDMGGIYTLGPQEGTVLRGNRIHDIRSFTYGGWGIYPDEGSTGILVENNCVFRTKSAGFHQHYGKENVIRNNVFAYGSEAQVMRTRAEEHLSLTFERNIVIFEGGPLLGSNWNGNNYRFDRNLYWRAGGTPFDFYGMSFEQWRAKGQDVHSMTADPLFVDPANGDFRLRTSSPASALGFTGFQALDPAFERRAQRAFPSAFPIP